jgi:hypothetical protein
MTEEELSLDIYTMPTVQMNSSDLQKIESRTKKSYGNKYLQNRRSISIENKIAERLDNIQTKKQIKTKGELFTFLANLEEAVDPKMETVYTCKTCKKKVDVPKNIKIDRFVHNDLCETESCKGYLISKTDIAYDTNGHVISNKGITTTKDESSETNEKKKKVDEEWGNRLGYRNGVRITDMDDPNYDNKFFDEDLPEYKEKMRSLGLI